MGNNYFISIANRLKHSSIKITADLKLKGLGLVQKKSNPLYPESAHTLDQTMGHTCNQGSRALVKLVQRFA